MEFALIKFKFYMQTLFNSYLHFDGSICIRLCPNIWNDKFFFLRYPIIISVYHHVNVVSQPNYNSIVAFELLFNSIKWEVIRHIICKGAWRFQVSYDLQESRVLIFIVMIFYDPNKLYSDT